ncbi:MAG: ATP synthase F1 subunit delta [Acidobacteria bacterium]|nr:ATP synthase F1 subunit delta [Acidobacteriota bacterium]MCA1627727.1 ATP synthase F1 subunit delta [Acidobacteriota bacterium]
MSLQTVARRYAQALADVVIERREEREVLNEIQSWASMIDGNPQLKEVFANPTVAYEQKQTVLEQLISRTSVRGTTASFLRVLLRNQRLAQLPEIAARFGQVLDERGGVVAAEITTARPIPEELKQTLHDTLASATGRTVRLTFATDENIIGGFVARIGSTIFDGSVDNHLERLGAGLAGN